jgi:hypothetical protein
MATGAVAVHNITELSYVQERFAKTVTNNLPLLSVLCGRSIFFYILQNTCLMLIFNLFFIRYLF